MTRHAAIKRTTLLLLTFVLSPPAAVAVAASADHAVAAAAFVGSSTVTSRASTADERVRSNSLKRIQELAGTPRGETSRDGPPSPDEEDDSIDRLLTWAEKEEIEGVDISEILTNDGAGLRGLFAREGQDAIGVGEYICAVPFTASLLIEDRILSNGDGDDDDPAGGDNGVEFEALLSDNNIDPDVVRGFKFLDSFVAGGEEKWRCYLDCLPKPMNREKSKLFDPTPDFWKESDIRKLQVPRMVEESIRRKRDVSKLVAAARGCGGNGNSDSNTGGDENIGPVLQRASGIARSRWRDFFSSSSSTIDGSNAANEASVSLLQWATWIVRSRGFSTFKLVREEAQDNVGDNEADCGGGSSSIQTRTVLLPFLDMINHSDDPNASIEVVEVPGAYDESFYALQAIRPIESGEEITISYGTGRETSLDLFAKYGFWTNCNPSDEYIDWDNAVDGQWTTTLDEDIQLLRSLTQSDNSNSDAVMESILNLRIHLKRLQQEKDEQ